jgi:hypothetical protein
MKRPEILAMRLTQLALAAAALLSIATISACEEERPAGSCETDDDCEMLGEYCEIGDDADYGTCVCQNAGECDPEANDGGE